MQDLLDAVALLPAVGVVAMLFATFDGPVRWIALGVAVLDVVVAPQALKLVEQSSCAR